MFSLDYIADLAAPKYEDSKLIMPVITFELTQYTVCGKKKYPLKFFAIFLATARNFYMKFHTFIPHS